MRHSLLFGAFLVVFYFGWVMLMEIGGHWASLAETWPVALSMALGSFVAGSTPMGGGTVGFPVLVLGFDFPAQLGRDFSFAIQSVGMVSAALFIFLRRQPLRWTILRPALVGTALGTPLGLLTLAPHVSGSVVKLVFALAWASFGTLQLVRLGTYSKSVDVLGDQEHEPQLGFFVGFLGGALVSSLTGVGVDMFLYVVLVFWLGADVKTAIPSSVVLMAWTSLVGLLTQSLTGALDPAVEPYWLAAAPVVVAGAPLGSLAIEKLERTTVLAFVSLLCLAQFGWTMLHEWKSLGLSGVGLCLGGLVGATIVLSRTGREVESAPQRVGS